MTTPDADKLREAFFDKGLPVPEALWPPELPPGYADWVEAFWELGTDRPMGMSSVGPIPSSSIRSWVSGWDDEEGEFFRRIIRSLDSVYLQWQQDKAKGGSGQTPRQAALSPHASPAFREAALQIDALSEGRGQTFSRDMMRAAFGGRAKKG